MWRAEDRPTIPSRIKVALHHWHMFYSCGAALVRHNRHTRACPSPDANRDEFSDLICRRTNQRRHRTRKKRNGGTPLKYNKI